jgi:hypothetical protein
VHDIIDLEARGVPGVFVATVEFIDGAEKQARGIRAGRRRAARRAQAVIGGAHAAHAPVGRWRSVLRRAGIRAASQRRADIW